jgi:anti-sigma regulatory factor (Ser/Thr protein kinase)
LARQFVSGLLAQHGVDDGIAQLVVSELASNVVRHARTPFTVGLSISGSTIRIEVEDGAAAMKVASDLAAERGGYGLKLVEELSTSWGVELRDDGKAVWVELSTIE